MDKDLKKLLKPYLKQGFTLIENKHYKLVAPDGRCVTFSHSSSCKFYLKHVEADFRRVFK